MNPKVPAQRRANSKYKDSFFTSLFSEPEKVLRLYNAISRSKYPLDTPIEITTLEDVLYRDRYNDLSFVIDGKLVVLVEHQSTINPNMPLRLLFYLSKVYSQYIKNSNVYSSAVIKIPRPEFIILYNGTEEHPDEDILRLSEAFYPLPDGHKPSGSLELTAKVLNINKERNQEIVRDSVELSGYVEVVDAIRTNKEAGMSLEDAIEKAVKECVDKGILTDFLEKHGGEIMDMLYNEYRIEDEIAVRVEEAERKAKLESAKQAYDLGLPLEKAMAIAEPYANELRELAND
ncbi:MAG: Rpn family recombination-promoting nuclease/putative transposase [Oscillospiraceae bacterium]|nr:Rpn family recombination-promoting nuclease/putative transposase [Oscillospiraceae bacterium]